MYKIQRKMSTAPKFRNLFLAGFILIIIRAHLLGAQFVAPGDTGSVLFEVKNDTESAAAMSNVSVSVTAPDFFIKQASSELGPVSILPGQNYIFKINYAISASAPEGNFSVNLNTSQDTQYTTNRSVARSVDFRISGLDTAPPQITVYNEGRGVSVPPANTLVDAPWLIGISTPFFTLSDSGSGLNMLALTDETGELISWKFFDGAATAEAQFSLPWDKPGYALLVGDNAGNESRLYFHVDRHEPKVEYTSVNVKVNGNYYSFDISGTATDAESGIGAGPVLLVNPPPHGDLGVHNTGATYPVPVESSSRPFTYLDLIGNGYSRYMVLVANKADNLGRKELWLTDQSEDWNYSLNGGWYTEYIEGVPPPDNMIVHEGVQHLRGYASGLHLLINRITLKDESSNCYISGDTEGMSATVSISEYTPDDREKERYQKSWNNIPLV